MMRMILCSAMLLFAACKTSAAAGVPAYPRVLFIGNSYTSFNNLPRIFQDLAASAGHAPSVIRAATPDGMTLSHHLHSPDTLRVIDEGHWDIVILQAQSQEAAMSEQISEVRSNFLEGATGLYDRIKTNSPRARIIFYETWARHADYWKDESADRSVGSNPTEMQARIRKWYQRAIGERKDVIIAPVGEAWALNYQNPKAVRLHIADNSHPAFNGSYLAALVIYCALYHPAKLNVSYDGALGRPEALYLQSIAVQAAEPRQLP